MVAGDLAVSTDRAVDEPGSSWHVDCFTCWQCHEPLVNLVHFWAGGRLYCGRHHAETIRPRCFACDEASTFHCSAVCKPTNLVKCRRQRQVSP